MAPEIVIRSAEPNDAGEILTVQRAAYVTEAQLYGDPHLVPLVETLAEIETAIATATVVVATTGHRIVGAVRLTVVGPVAEVGRLVVAPDQQGRGIATGLLDHLHGAAPDEVERFELFTGHRSEGNLRLYDRHGYREFDRITVNDALDLLHLRRAR